VRNEDDEEDERIFQQLQRKPRAAAKPTKKTTRRRHDPFVKFPLWWAEAAAKAIKSPGVVVLVELLRRQFETRSNTFSRPNGRLLQAGVTRNVKRRVLRNLELAGLISVERRPNNNPIITLTLL
jgi:hypothetical protein